MPWLKTDYPVSMKNLPTEVRNKAIEIANALLEETDLQEGVIIATAISRAKDWAANRGKKVESKKSTRKTDVKEHGKDVWVTPYAEDEWAVKEEGEKKPRKVTRSKAEAVKVAKKSARKAKASVTVQRKTGRTQTRVSYTPHRQRTTGKKAGGKKSRSK